MKKFNKIISMLLVVFMLVSAIAVALPVGALAADSDSNTSSGSDNKDNNSNSSSGNNTTEEVKDIDHLTQLFATPEEKLATMTLMLDKGDYQLYADKKSGELACVNKVTGDKIFTNPYDVGASMGDATTKYEILSQIIVKFKDNKGQEKLYSSYEYAALRDQIVVAPIKNGVRVEYTIGREQSKSLVPRLISKERFDSMILAPLEEEFGEELYSDRPSDEVFKIQKILTYYTLYSKDRLPEEEYNKKTNVLGIIIDGIGESDRQLQLYRAKYPIIDSMAFYQLKTDISDTELAKCEQIIIKYCPDYSYEELDYDHAITDYESEDENPPVFRMALEYRVDENGLLVRLPANGIRFNESLYTLEGIEVLPYMGAGNSGYSGFNFFPDGSGTLFDFESLNTNQTRSVTSNLYGTDYAYHEIKGTYQKAIRYPVFGIVENTNYYTYTDTDIETGEVKSQFTISGAMVDAIEAYLNGESAKVYKGNEKAIYDEYGSKLVGKKSAAESHKRGFVAIIEQGDALASLTTYHAGSLSDYNTVKMSFIPRPKDTYNLQDSISVGTNSDWTVVSKRKYVGNYKMRYIMLSDAENVADKGVDYYDASWFGMAVAYRDYLTANGVISKKTAEEVNDDIPLYIETFGAVETTEKFLSVPITVTAPLTTFEQVIQMYDELSADKLDENGNVVEAGIKNINFKLTGYANGGMYYSVPGNLKFEKAVGGNKGFQALLDKAAEINNDDKKGTIGIYPDFDFVYQLEDKLFDGYSKVDHAAKTIDDRYATRREYSATQQKYINYYELVISPAYFNVLYNRLEKNYADKYENVIGISVSTLGQWLNSDFDEDEPYNREDDKSFTIEAFKHFDETYGDVMTSAGNAYVWQYADHILNVSLDSSRYNFSANAVPFIGVVLHGSISFTGEPLNMEGDLQYALLKAIENGASPYFILSMDNTQALKEYTDLSRYYSIRYDIWKDDISDVYSVLNEVLADVQDKYIIDHQFIIGERVPGSDELMDDIYDEYIGDLEAENNAAEILANELALRASQARKDGRLAEEFAAEALLSALSLYTTGMTNKQNALTFGSGYYERVKSASILYYNAEKSGNTESVEKYSTILGLVKDNNIDAENFEEIYDAMAASIKNLASKLTANHKEFVKGYMPVAITAFLAENRINVGAEFATKLADAIVNDYTGTTSTALEKFIKEYLADTEKVSADIAEKFDDTVVKNLAKELNTYLKTDCGKTVISSIYSGLNTSVIALLNLIDKHGNNIVAYNDALAAYYDLGEAEAEKAVADAQAAYDADPTEENKKVLDDAKAALTAIADVKAVYEAYEQAKVAYDATVDAETKAAYDNAYAEYTAAVEKIANALKAVAEARKAVAEAQAAYEAAPANVETETESESETETNEKSRDELLAELNAANEAYDSAISAVYALAYENFLDSAVKNYNDAKAAYLAKGDEAAKAALDAAQAAFDATVDADVKSAINKGETAVADYAVGDAKLGKYYYQYNYVIPTLEDIANDYFYDLATKNARKQVVESGFKLSYDECLEVYFNYEKANAFYKQLQKTVKDGNAPAGFNEVFVALYNEYAAADTAKAELEALAKEYASANSKGRVDLYVAALADMAALKELGYDAENATEDMKKKYDSAVESLETYRKNSITFLSRLDGSTLKSLSSLVELTKEHYGKAKDAVDVLTSGNFSNRIVEQAKGRENAVYEYLYGDANYVAIPEGRLSEYSIEVGGETVQLYYVRNDASELRYYYGTLETGYTYLIRNEDGSFSVAERGLNGKASPTGATWNGLSVYVEGTIYYVATLEGTDTVKPGFTYLTKNKYYDTYEERAAVVYKGTKVDTLADGTEIFFDKAANVYYSVNEDGTYTRYNYYMSISEYYNDVVKASADTLKQAYAVIAECDGLDTTFEADVKARINRENSMNEVVEEETEEEEVSKYLTENIVTVTYGNEDGSAYKTVILNYNNYAVKVVVDGAEYTIDAYQFVVVKHDNK